MVSSKIFILHEMLSLFSAKGKQPISRTVRGGLKNCKEDVLYQDSMRK